MPEAPKLKAIDITDIELPEGPDLTIDPTADAYDIPPPPPAGKYAVKLFLASDGWQQGQMDERDPNTVYYVAPLEMRITEGEYKGRTIYGRVDTRIWPGRQTSTMATCLAKRLGPEKVPQKVTARQLAQLFDKFLKKQPNHWVYIDWQAYSRNEGQVICDGMVNFPKRPDGSHDPIVRDKKGTPCYARANLVRFLSAEEYKASEVPPVPPPPAIDETAGLDDELPF